MALRWIRRTLNLTGKAIILTFRAVTLAGMILRLAGITLRLTVMVLRPDGGTEIGSEGHETDFAGSGRTGPDWEGLKTGLEGTQTG